MMDGLAQLVEGRQNSALTDILTDEPRLVDPVAEVLPPASLESPFQSLTQLFKPLAKPVSQVRSAVSPIDDDEPEEAYVPLSPEEIKTKAESKAEMWGAVIALLFGFIERYAAYQKLREGDKQLIKEHDNTLARTGSLPTYPSDHPYYAARERWDDFEEALKEADDEAMLTPAQLTLLQRAIEADLKSKNKRGKLKTGSIAEVLFEIMVIKAMGPLMMGGQAFMSKMVDKSMR